MVSALRRPVRWSQRTGLRGGPLCLKDLGEPTLECRRYFVANRALNQPFDQRLEEALDDQRLRRGRVEATRGEVEELVAVHLGDGRGVGAAHVVRFDLQAWDRVGVRRGREQQV